MRGVPDRTIEYVRQTKLLKQHCPDEQTQQHLKLLSRFMRRRVMARLDRQLDRAGRKMERLAMYAEWSARETRGAPVSSW